MPVPGTKPKPDGQKRNRNKPTIDWIEVLDVPYAGKPPVAPKSDWPAATKRWWRVVSRMPHCVTWTESDWQFALDTGLLAAAFHGGNMGAANELRQREKILGTTGDARRDLRIRYVSADVEDNEDDATVTAIADYRAMLDE